MTVAEGRRIRTNLKAFHKKRRGGESEQRKKRCYPNLRLEPGFFEKIGPSIFTRSSDIAVIHNAIVTVAERRKIRTNLKAFHKKEGEGRVSKEKRDATQTFDLNPGSLKR